MTALRLVPLAPPGAEKQPTPFMVFDDGSVGEQYLWHGHPSRLVGFQARFDRIRVDVDLAAFLADPDSALGLYPVFVDAAGDAHSYLLAVDRVEEVAEDPQRWWVEMSGHYDGPAGQGLDAVVRVGDGADLDGYGTGLSAVSSAAFSRLIKTTVGLPGDRCDACGQVIGYHLDEDEQVAYRGFWVTADGRGLCAECGATG